ncbi:MAG TPA: alpha/beta hydrolase-fold protein [Ohtaekwangia sp.]
MTRLIFLLVCIIRVIPCDAQNYSRFTQTTRMFYISPSVAEKVLQNLSANAQIPFVVEDSVAFLYRGEATSVLWMGDFNGSGYDKKFPNKGSRIPGTDIWILKASFPQDARLDYKILVNESTWVLDPENPHQQWSGVGGGTPNSELRMPHWKEDPITQPMPAIFHGRVIQDLLIKSEHLGYQISYSIYLPPDFNPSTRKVYPVIYVTDGYEYLHERMGNMATILDNLIHLQKIKPVIAIFIDHREPVNRINNRRMQELALNEQYLAFITKELIPRVESKYPIATDAKSRAILGTSMGGLTAAYFAFSKPDVFGMAGIQSPAFWFRPEIYTLCDSPENPPVKIFMTTGLINDTQEGAEKMRSILDKNTCNYQFQQVNQGHSWGNWRDLIDDILVYFFPTE